MSNRVPNLMDLPAPPPPVTTNLYDANRQWAYRRDDEKYLDLPSLARAVHDRKERSKEYPAFLTRELKPEYVKEGPLMGNLFVVKYGLTPITFTNWSFNQYVSLVKGPNMAWLREMPAPVAAAALEASMMYRARVGSDSLSKLYVTPPLADEPNGQMRAITSPSYGRIYDAEVVDQVMRINQDDRWTVPLKAYGGKNSKQATTLYASDRDVWIFLVDESRPIYLDGTDDPYFRGFFVWNSEVGSQTMGVKTFLHRYVCQNRIVWEATQIRELRIRHSKMAPERFLRDAMPLLASYSEAGAKNLEESVALAKRAHVARDIEGAEAWLRERGFGQEQSRAIVNLAEQDGGAEPDAQGNVKQTDPTNLWNLAGGITAFARGIPYTDERVAMETKAGDLLSTAGRYAGRERSQWVAS